MAWWIYPKINYNGDFEYFLKSTEHLKWVDFMVYKLYHSKAIFKFEEKIPLSGIGKKEHFIILMSPVVRNLIRVSSMTCLCSMMSLYSTVSTWMANGWAHFLVQHLNWANVGLPMLLIRLPQSFIMGFYNTAWFWDGVILEGISR